MRAIVRFGAGARKRSGVRIPSGPLEAKPKCFKQPRASFPSARFRAPRFKVSKMSDPEVEKIVNLLDSMSNDFSVPRNVRSAIQTAKDKLGNSEDMAQGISGAIYALDEMSNDINLPMHARTMIWNILSELEVLKEKHVK
jgi:uncharacterized protein (UPF0147 family)